MPPFDVVIVSCAKDFKVLPYCIKSVQKFVSGFSNIFLVTQSQDLSEAQLGFLASSNVKIVDEMDFRWVDKKRVAPYVRHDRASWYYQQLLKLYAFDYIPNLQEYYLVIDSDVVFFKSYNAFDECGKPMYAYGDEHNKPYFAHMARLLPNLCRTKDMSGICHHMMFHVPKLIELFEAVETLHGKPFWMVFLEAVDARELSGASEYEIYFNYMCAFHPDEMHIRQLLWRNWSNDYDTHLCTHGALDFIGLHAYMCPSSLDFLDGI
jgi:hypothetical protein